MLQKLTREIARSFESMDVLITPTLAEPPAPLGTFDSPPGEPLLGLLRAASYVPFTPPFNVTGQPAVSLPLHWNAEGLPIGVQFVGRFGEEETLLSLAAGLEEAAPWSGRRPPVGA
jgi:amidase